MLISHLHADHCHLPSLRLLAPDTLVIGPARTGRLPAAIQGRRRSLRCQELVAGDEVAVGDLTVRALYADHDDRRSPARRHRAQPLSFLVAGDRGGAAPLWFGGDTAMHDGISAGRAGRASPSSRWQGGDRALGPGHLNAEQAAEAVRRSAAEIGDPDPLRDVLAARSGLGGQRPVPRALSVASPSGRQRCS